MYGTAQEMLEQKWGCEVGGITWWSGYPDFRRTEGEYVVRNDKVMWPRDLGEISVSLSTWSFSCAIKTQSSQTQQLFILALFQQHVSA
jgi:hypothetical protein